MGDKLVYAMVIGALALLGFALFGMPQGREQGQFSGAGYSATASFSGAGSIPQECGDINNPKNLQHLSHHPDRFQECYKFVDPAKFRAAVGQDLSNFMRR